MMMNQFFHLIPVLIAVSQPSDVGMFCLWLLTWSTVNQQPRQINYSFVGWCFDEMLEEVSVADKFIIA